jgi:hypothetical protein
VEPVPEIVDPTPEVTALVKEQSVERAIAEMSNNLQVKLQAYQLFLNTDQTPEEIGLSLSLPGFLVKHWAAVEEWGRRKGVWLGQEYKRKEAELQSLRAEHAIPTAQRQLKAARLVEEEITEVVESLKKEREDRAQEERGLPRNYDMTLNRLSQALKNVSDISARIVGLDTQPRLSESDAAKTIIMIGGKPAQGVRFSEEKKGKVIDIE